MKPKIAYSFLSIMLLSMFVHINSVVAQMPSRMSYQAVIRDTENKLVANKPVGMRMSILKGTASGTEVYSEIFNPNPQTNSNGLVTVEIGGGIPTSGSFDLIKWAEGPYFLKTEVDPTGGTNYTISGLTQLLSVPYALFSKTASTFDYNNLTNKPNLSKVANTGEYKDLLNTPIIPNNLNQITPDAGNRRVTNVLTPINNNDAVNKAYVDLIKTKVFEKGNNTSSQYTIGNNTDIFTTEDGFWNLVVNLPAPNQANNNLYSRIGTFLMIRCRSSFSFTLSKDNTDLPQNLVLTYGQTVLFVYDGEKWIKVVLSVGVLTVSTRNVSSISQTTATSGGNVSNDGGSSVTSKGVCWSTSPNPTIANSKTINGTGIGEFSSSLTGLTAGTKYYVRAYATNAFGTVYGNETIFTTMDASQNPYYSFSVNRTDLYDFPDNKLYPNTWYNIVVTRSNFTNSWELYINGVHKKSDLKRENHNLSTLMVGFSNYAGAHDFYDGYLDELRISNIARTATEVANNFSSNKPYSIDANTVALWHFDETNGTSVINSVNSVSGTLKNGVSFLNGRFGNALYFDGKDDFGDLNFDIPDDVITIEYWIKFPSIQLTQQTIIYPFGANITEHWLIPHNN